MNDHTDQVTDESAACRYMGGRHDISRANWVDQQVHKTTQMERKKEVSGNLRAVKRSFAMSRTLWVENAIADHSKKGSFATEQFSRPI